MKILITGAAGFIGNAAWEHYDGHQRIGIDNYARSFCSTPPRADSDDFFIRDVREIESIPLPNVDVVIHLAAQTSVTRSETSPMADFQANAEGTLRLLLWAREHGCKRFIYASSNKVFGELAGNEQPTDDSQKLNPRTPYGISKATGALYVREIMPECGYVFHQSCIYGETQKGSEDQGWIGYLLGRVRRQEPITCYGDGSQVRDLLHVTDLFRAYDLAIDGGIEPGSYIIGGGIENALSFKRVVELIGGKITTFSDWRSCDQKYFVSRNSFLTMGGWKPRVNAEQWLNEHRPEIL